jgi:hypothetical protein
MAKSKKPKISLADRRGVFPLEAWGDSWEMILIQIAKTSSRRIT